MLGLGSWVRRVRGGGGPVCVRTDKHKDDRRNRTGPDSVKSGYRLSVMSSPAGSPQHNHGTAGEGARVKCKSGNTGLTTPLTPPDSGLCKAVSYDGRGLLDSVVIANASPRTLDYLCFRWGTRVSYTRELAFNSLAVCARAVPY